MSNSLYSVRAEESALSILINNPEFAFEHNDLIPEMFSSVPSQLLFKTIKNLVLTNASPSVYIIKARLKAGGNFSMAGGDEYIDYITKLDTDTKNFKPFEDIIINSYKARKILEMSSSIPAMVGENSDNVNNVISNLRDRLDSLAIDYSKNGVVSLGDSLKESVKVFQHRIKNPGLSGFSTGYDHIDALTGGLTKGELWIIGARPSMGKTSYILNSILKTTAPSDANINTLLFSLEMSRQGLNDRFISIDSNVNLSSIRLGSMDKKEIESVNNSLIKLQNNTVYVDANFHTDPSYLVNTINRYHKNVGIDIVYIDYIQLLVERDERATNELGRVSRAMKKLAKDLNISICIASQLNRLLELRENKRPELSDLRQSGNLEEDADIVAFLYRDEIYNKDTHNKGVMEFIIKKNRNGPPGTLHLTFDKETTRIEKQTHGK
jgi:replicative DNA helicase